MYRNLKRELQIIFRKYYLKLKIPRRVFLNTPNIENKFEILCGKFFQFISKKPNFIGKNRTQM